MAFGTRSAITSSKPHAEETGGLHLNWGERVVTAVAAGIAVVIVATIAVLMGMV
ncbi:MAG: hypothetical protein ACRECA_06805 [Pseudolabrys sp.]